MHGRRTSGDMDASGRSTSSNNSHQRYQQQQQQQQGGFSPSSFAFMNNGSTQQRFLQMQFQQQQLQLQQLQQQQQQVRQQQAIQQQQQNALQQQQQQQQRPSPVGSPRQQQMQQRANFSPTAFFSVPSPATTAKPTMTSKAATTTQPQQQPPPSLPPPPLVVAKQQQPTSKASMAATTTAAASLVPPSSKNNGSKTPQPNVKQQQRPAPPQQRPQPPAEPIDVPKLLKECPWVDKTLWVSRQLLGGQAVNGFLRSTATVQRIKKQRARQVKSRLQTPKDNNDNNNNNMSEQESEERLKHQVMNPRTAKKIKLELEQGMAFCEMLHGTVRGILHELHGVSGIPVPPPLGPELPQPPPSSFPRVPPPMTMAVPPPPTTTTTVKAAPAPKKAKPAPAPVQRVSSTTTASSQQQKSMTVTPGNAKGSQLRRYRRKKLPPNTEPVVTLSEFDPTGKRVLTKKEHTCRVFECLRFRTLRQGDLCAARLTSRDLWILARVLQDSPGNDSMSAFDFLQLTEAKRDQLFKDKVAIQDVEDKQHEGRVMVARNLILPLPRSFAEAADWGQRYKKGFRVYAMYPETTSLYTATVVDCTTYCRADDDIIVVEFDGDEPDATTGGIPQCHIPARFVTLIPREFPGAQVQQAATTNKSKKASRPQSRASSSQPAAVRQMDDPLNNVLDNMPFDGMSNLAEFDDLDFDLGLS